MEIHLIDGTYELFRQFFGQRHRIEKSDGTDVAATVGVLGSLLTMIEEGATHLAVATDHKIESFRNDLWPGYKTGAGVDPALLAQFPILEDSLRAMGVAVFAMDELEADDGLASLAAIAADSSEVDRVLIWTPDKDLGQCVRGERVVQVDRRNQRIMDEKGIWEKFGVAPSSIPDWLALVGDSADGFPGIAGWGKQTASSVLAHYGHLEQIPSLPASWDDGLRNRVRSVATLSARLQEDFELALLFRDLATLRVEKDLVSGPEDLLWGGPLASFPELARELSAERLAERADRLAARAN
jgi:5'-3' exonuclease